jgi:hypothetical protein
VKIDNGDDISLKIEFWWFLFIIICGTLLADKGRRDILLYRQTE